MDNLDVHLAGSAAAARGGLFGTDKPVHEAAAGARTTGYCTGGAGLDVMADCRSLCVCTIPLLSEVPVSGLSAVEIEVVSEPVWDTLSTLIRGGDDGRT